ncbi:DHHC palmitoyltransferase [Ceratobasidium sp. AG-Ba]|nr:DHHC palmitoyltransferase [Ceratobasidium sp. AG-Ba]
MPLLNFTEPIQPVSRPSRRASTQHTRVPRVIRRLFHLVKTYGPAIIAVVLVISAYPSIIVVTTAHHYKIDGSVASFVAHIAVASLLTFVGLSSFIVCVSRDPGPVAPLKSREEDVERDALVSRPGRNDEEISLADALAGPSIGDAGSSDEDSEVGVDDQGERRWCRKCWAPKPERAHHCSYCKRCVLKMDHHCPWLANNCVGHRTYPSFIHFLLSTTLIAAHAVSVSVSPLKWYFNNSLVQVVDLTPLHALYLALGGAVFTICMGSFVGFHIYLVTSDYTGTTLTIYAFEVSAAIEEQQSGSFESDVDLRTMLKAGPDPEGDTHSSAGSSDLPPSRLESLPVYPPPGHSVPVTSRENAVQFAEHTMTRNQRRLVRSAAGKIRVYDLGWRKNWLDMFSVRRERFWLDWIEIVWWGGHGTRGDGRTFIRNPKAQSMLVRLRERLENM